MRTLKKPQAACAALLAVSVALQLGGCTMLEPKALEPIDWADKSIERHAVTGRGALARLRNEPVRLGPYTAISEGQRPWSHLPVQTSSDMQIGLGGEQGRQVSAGTSSVRNESEVKIRLQAPAGELAAIHCREVLNIENREARMTNSRGEDDMKVTENIAYEASLNCRSRSLGPSWPQWQLDLHATGKNPLRGTLSIDGVAFDVVGSQASSIGVMPDTVSYEVRKGQNVLALIDRSGDGHLSIVNPIGEKQHTSILGAAAVLLLAHDPLSE